MILSVRAFIFFCLFLFYTNLVSIANLKATSFSTNNRPWSTCQSLIIQLVAMLSCPFLTRPPSLPLRLRSSITSAVHMVVFWISK